MKVSPAQSAHVNGSSISIERIEAILYRMRYSRHVYNHTMEKHAIGVASLLISEGV